MALKYNDVEYKVCYKPVHCNDKQDHLFLPDFFQSPLALKVDVLEIQGQRVQVV